MAVMIMLSESSYFILNTKRSVWLVDFIALCSCMLVGLHGTLCTWNHIACGVLCIVWDFIALCVPLPHIACGVLCSVWDFMALCVPGTTQLVVYYALCGTSLHSLYLVVVW